MRNLDLHMGIGGKFGTWNLNVDYHGFKLGRHSSGKGIVINYKAADGKQKNMLVLDAAYRSVLQFGMYGIDTPELTQFQKRNKAEGFYIDGTDYGVNNNKQPMPDGIINSVIYEQWKSAFLNDKTSKENCDIWMTYNSKKDSKSILGVPAVAWCRQQTVNGLSCDLPNAYEVTCLWACGDKLDELDPTAASNSGLRLGYTANEGISYANLGRQQSANGQFGYHLWSSTRFDYNSVNTIDYQGCIYGWGRYTYNCVVPILELD